MSLVTLNIRSLDKNSPVRGRLSQCNGFIFTVNKCECTVINIYFDNPVISEQNNIILFCFK